jgi:hypothetical protein
MLARPMQWGRTMESVMEQQQESLIRMLRTHPRAAPGAESSLAAVIQSCFICAQACVACADACLAEEQRNDLVRCIRLNLDCADICFPTGRILSRQTEVEQQVVEHMLQACVAACGVCAQECGFHGEHMEHCKVCEEACRACERACNELHSTRRH